jgi:putative endonuclease
MDERRWIVYLIRCSDESLYCGVTNNLKKRLAAHNLGRGAKYTRSRRPVELVGASSEMTKSDALKLEYQIKQAHASKKNYELTKERNQEMKNLKKELQAVNREIKALSKKVDRMIVTVGKLDKPKVVKAKPVKKTATKAKPVKKVAVKKTPVKKVVVKKPSAKKPVKLTATDMVLNIIKRYKKGVGIPILKTKSGFNDKKVRNIVQKAFKEGKVKRVDKGIYVKA